MSQLLRGRPGSGRPGLAITLGDPAGIGAEVALKALARAALARVRAVLIGDVETLRETAARLRLRLRLVAVTEAEVAGGALGRRQAWPTRPGERLVPVVAASALGPRARRPGRPSIEGGRASRHYVEVATRLAQVGAVSAIVTAPISKEWVARAGFPAGGHTELLQKLTGAREVRMMLAGRRLRVVLVTTHLALAAVPRSLTMQGVLRTILVADEHLRQYHRVERPRIAVAGLNPHAGEGGLFGSEERALIAPAVAQARRAGVAVSGPFPADSLFVRAVEGAFDAVVAMYHDQGLIPLKLLHFHDGVNVTLGLPILRTSPDHGTAHDIAGRGVADERSMVAAIRLAASMARARRAEDAATALAPAASGARRRQA